MTLFVDTMKGGWDYVCRRAVEIEVQGNRGRGRRPERRRLFLVIYSKRFRELFFSSLECVVHDRLPPVWAIRTTSTDRREQRQVSRPKDPDNVVYLPKFPSGANELPRPQKINRPHHVSDLWLLFFNFKQ